MSRPTPPAVPRPPVLSIFDELPSPPRFRTSSLPATASERPISPVNSMGAGGVSGPVPPTPRQVDAQLAQPHAHLDRTILQDKDLDLIESMLYSGGSDVSALLRGRSPLSMAMLRATPAPATTPPPLQPPPRRRGYTIGSTPMGARPRPETVAGNAYTHANTSTAESFGLRAAGMGMLFAPHPPLHRACYASNKRHASSAKGSMKSERVERAVMIALGEVDTGVFQNSGLLWQELDKAGKMEFDLFWRMLLLDAYAPQITSSNADLYNVH
ncbi:uncharacterized protein C8Q71DRAFT_724568 [Rhodofomes roseus]|uniref:Cytosol aminopeptidase domain-containing protein n=1 Tax=Rhodofomes roseus TaxID=34475 RepID=A0ABQ8KC86_9APHY|nr:uncharacterized protein C8Q71DRAFT_724568 [Rhodofomes roseus]KAH9835214.1 hypothetical protein C8Q71DRAFT_724568 [Rhodofomes roseus]